MSFTATGTTLRAGFAPPVFPDTIELANKMCNIDCKARSKIFNSSGIFVSNMSRPMSADCTLTLIYNPSAGTLHGAYNREPEILLKKEIPVGNVPLQPFVIISGGEENPVVTIVSNPRAGL